jgi:N-ethylmaleimide reductase
MYLHVLEGPAGDDPGAPRPLTTMAREAFPGVIIANAGYTADAAERVLACGDADLIAFGVPFLSTPDFVERTRSGAPLNTPDRATFYGGDARGYVDSPFRDGTVRLSIDGVVGAAAGVA